MSREAKKRMDRITAITEKWITASYSNASTQDIWKYKNRMNDFLEFLGLSDAEFIEGYKRAKDRHEWAKQTGLKLVAFYNDRISHNSKRTEHPEPYATNTVRAEVSTVRAFCRDNATTLLLPRKKIAKAKSAKGEHEFTREELAKMFYVADVRGKAILATAVSLGFSVEDFSELKRDYVESLVNKALTEKIDFIGFDYERGKTGVESRSHLTPETVSSLRDWFVYIDKIRAEKGHSKSEFVWCNNNGGHLDEQTINDIIKDLVQKANSANHENAQAIAYFIEEAQDCFSNRSSARLEMEEFLTVFNEARNNKESFWTASQRLTDFSKTIRSKQLPCIGKLATEDITPSLRRIEKAQKAQSLSFDKMPPKTWYFEGSTLTSPDFKQRGKPYIINDQIKKTWIDSLPTKETLAQKISQWFTKRKENKSDNNMRNKQNPDQSVYEPDNQQATQEDDMEEDLALLNEEEMGW